MVNPGSVILCGVLLFHFLGWHEAGDALERAMEETIRQKYVTLDFQKSMPGATLATTTQFAQRIVENMADPR